MQISSPEFPLSHLCMDARYRSGFGCIRCGCTVYRYCRAVSEPGDDPATAAIADDGALFLLCPPCLDRMRGNPDVASVLAVLLRNPLPRQNGFYRAGLPYMRGDRIADTHFASGAVMRATAFPVVFEGTALLALVQPEVDDGPMRLSVVLGGSDGLPAELVKSNVWVADERWRFERHNTRYIISQVAGDAFLELAFEPGMVMRIERLCTRLGGRTLHLDRTGCRVDGEPVVIRGGSSQLVGVRI